MLTQDGVHASSRRGAGPEAIDAGMTKVADLGRFAYEQTFGDKPTDMFMKARLVIGSRPHLHQFIWTGQDLCLEALHEEVVAGAGRG